MARITVEDCLEHCENRFSLVHIAAKRTRELYKGIEPMVHCKNREVVTALREIAAGKVGYRDDTPDEDETSFAPVAPKKTKKSS